MPHIREPYIPIRPLEMAVLLYHLYEAAKDPNIGWLDAENSIKMISREMNKKPAKIRRSLVESALFCCNLSNEGGKFWHPKGQGFDDFVNELITKTQKQLDFDRFSNLILERAPNRSAK